MNYQDLQGRGLDPEFLFVHSQLDYSGILDKFFLHVHNPND